MFQTKSENINLTVLYQSMIETVPSHQTKHEASQIEIWNNLIQWSVYQIFNLNAPCTNVKPTYCRLSGDGSVMKHWNKKVY